MGLFLVGPFDGDSFVVDTVDGLNPLALELEIVAHHLRKM